MYPLVKEDIKQGMFAASLVSLGPGVLCEPITL